MDLSRFDTREAAEAGVNVPLVIDGETITGDDGQPITFRLKGIADKGVHEVLLKQRVKSGNTPDEILANDLRLARAAVSGWSDNFTVEGKKLPFTDDNLAIVMGNPVVRRCVLAEVFREQNFMRKP